MIRPAQHHVTHAPRVAAECDTNGCTEALYIADALSVVGAGDILRSVGWDIGTYHGGDTLTAHCPTHATNVEGCRHTTIVMLEGIRHCQRCGRAQEAA